jgi:hypothetical protein
MSPRALGELNAAAARSNTETVEALSRLLGQPSDQIHRTLSGVHGRTLVRNVFGAAFSFATGEAWESTDEEGGTDIEEEIGDDEEHIRPYDPDKIRVDPKTFSLQQLMEDIGSGDLDLAPDFQRNKVWGMRQKVRLVESVLLRIPLPAFYFSADKAGKFGVVDGVQRLSTLAQFFNNEFGLTRSHLEYLTLDVLSQARLRKGDLESCFFENLDGQWVRRLRQTQMVVNVIDPQTPEEVKFEIFKRINTGGSPLNAQEIRHSMMKKRSRDFLRDLSSSEAFLSAVPLALHHHPRMADREVILRLMAFILLGDPTRYPDTTMDQFLVQAARRLDDSSDISDESLESLRKDFEMSMQNAELLFGARAFRKWPPNNERYQPFNKALFETWGFALRKRNPAALLGAREKIVQASRDALNDRDYLASITVSTGDLARVRLRFAWVTNIVEGLAP